MEESAAAATRRIWADVAAARGQRRVQEAAGGKSSGVRELMNTNTEAFNALLKQNGLDLRIQP